MKKGTGASKDRTLLTLELVARRLKAMAEPARLALLQSLRDGEKSVSELVEETGFGQTNVSKHLRILKGEGFVSARRERRNIIYGLSNGLSEEVCRIVCRSMREDATGESRMLRRYLEGKRAHKIGRTP